MNPIEPDGMVIEDEVGNRLIAVPTAWLEIMRFAAVVQYTRQGRTYRMRVDGLGDQPAVLPMQPQGPAPAPAPAYIPSPTPPPAALVLLSPVDTIGYVTCRNPECRTQNRIGSPGCMWCNSPLPTGE